MLAPTMAPTTRAPVIPTFQNRTTKMKVLGMVNGAQCFAFGFDDIQALMHCRNWDERKVGDWLRSINADKYIELFRGKSRKTVPSDDNDPD